MMGFSRYSFLVLIFVLEMLPFVKADAQHTRSTNKPTPPTLSLLSIDNTQVSLLVTKIDPRVGRVTLQRKDSDGAFRNHSTLRLATQSSSSVSLSDDSVPSGEVLYRVRVQGKGGEWSKWSRPLKVKVELSHGPLRPSPPSTTLCNNQQLDEALALANEVRAKNGAGPLVVNSALVVAAQLHSNRMAKSQSLSHNGWSQTILDAGYQGSGMAQNIAQGFPTVQSTLQAWLESQGHRENLLYTKWSETGFGCTVDGFGRMWWTQNFGKN